MNTPPRAVRIDKDLWSRVVQMARQTGVTASDVVRDAVTAYVGPQQGDIYEVAL